MASIWGSDWCLILQVSSTLPPTLGQTSLGHFLPQSNPTQPPLPPTHPSNRQTSHTPHHLCRPPGTFISERLPGRPAEVGPGVRGRGPGLSRAHLGVRLRGEGACLAWLQHLQVWPHPVLAGTRDGGVRVGLTLRGAVVTSKGPLLHLKQMEPPSRAWDTPLPTGAVTGARRAAGDMKTSAREFGMELGQIGTWGA